MCVMCERAALPSQLLAELTAVVLPRPPLVVPHLPCPFVRIFIRTCMANDHPTSSNLEKPKQCRSCFQFFSDASMRSQEKRAQRTKQPWLTLKLSIGIASAIIAYASYVYIGRLCVPMLKRSRNALGGRGMGVGFIIIVILLGFMMIWCYIKVVFTPPGFAKDHVANSAPIYPLSPPQRYTHRNHTAREPTIGMPYEATRKTSAYTFKEHNAPATPHTYSRTPSSSTAPRTDELHVNDGRSLSSVPSIPATFRDPLPTSTLTSPSVSGSPLPSPLTPLTPTTSTPSPEYHPRPSPNTSSRPHAERRVTSSRGKEENRQSDKRRIERRPFWTPILTEEYRYCRRCNLLKPPRAHHCRSCGTNYGRTEAAAGIGQCVGALNHKFFIDFLVWACLFCFWIFTTLVGLNAKAGTGHGSSPSIDPQHIIVIALSGLFTIFTSIMLITHTMLISANMTTVEHMSMRTMKETERGMLAELHPFWAISAKKRTLKEWEKKWGRMEKEGNLWWQGSVRKHWELVMGPNAWTWFLPIGRGTSDGVTFERNPRFDEKGRWRPRVDWPRELQ
ncbi:hypothetical protein EW146_g1939 [Bondarzewia mesenterica]|uniref:Palmitoyltransferase n=1 Tax=Bondarzewia mesenterica TaxID=1095465 RepID=A0A4S4M8H8_9AGAM|nr:hypothetical protein EW146_g1939 [Bondarzewia mesenterica]